MSKFLIRFFIQGLAVDGWVEAATLADAIGEAHAKLSGSLFHIKDINGSETEMIESSRVEHITIMGFDKALQSLGNNSS